MRVLITFVPPVFNSIEYKGMVSQTSSAIFLLGNILRVHNIETNIVDPYYILAKNYIGKENIDFSDLLKDVDIVSLSSNSFNWGTTLEFIRNIKKWNDNIKIVLGGIHPTKFDQYTLTVSGADVVIRGEGERVLPSVIKGLRKNGINGVKDITGVTYRNEMGEVIRNPQSKLLTVEEYNHIPFPEYEEMPHNFYSSIPLETSRGCLFNCIFCGVNYHKSFRELSVESACQKFDHIKRIAEKKTRTGSIVFCDDCFTCNKERMRGIFEHIQKTDGNYQLMIEGRLDDLYQYEYLDEIPYKKIGRFLVGIESGYDEGLKTVRKG